MSRTFRRKKKPSRKRCNLFINDYVGAIYSHKGRRLPHFLGDRFDKYADEQEKIETEIRWSFYSDSGFVYGNVAYLKWNSKKRIRANERDYCKKVLHYEFNEVPVYEERNIRSLIWLAF